MNVSLLEITPRPEYIISKAYGTCTGKDTIPVENIQKWVKLGHLSPIEHAYASFLISGISRACSHQLVRHRLNSFSQQSMRYTDSKNNSFVLPETIRQDDYLRVKTLSLFKQIYELYEECQDRKVPNEDARFVLPIATETKLVMSGNFRQWRKVIELRCEKSAQWEIRKVCFMILLKLHRQSPNVFQDLKERFIDEI